jgi:hypothetical protein
VRAEAAFASVPCFATSQSILSNRVFMGVMVSGTFPLDASLYELSAMMNLFHHYALSY